MSDPIPIEQWPDFLESALDRACSLFRRPIVVRQTDSTQDAARRLKARAGDVIVAWRQTAGRGQFGRRWADTAEHGVAMTLVTHRSTPQRLVAATAQGVAQAAESLLGRPVHVKPPNDIIVDARKLAGVLVEQADHLAYIGIGMNVGQIDWPDALRDRAVSFAQLGVPLDRLHAIEALIVHLDQALREVPAQAAHAGASQEPSTLRAL